jgi:hypothetical protein
MFSFLMKKRRALAKSNAHPAETNRALTSVGGLDSASKRWVPGLGVNFAALLNDRITHMPARWLISACIAGVLLGGSPGVRPRAGLGDYPTRQSANGFSIGAALIPRSEVKKIFATDLNGAGYVVVEVGVYPAPGREVDVSPADFMLMTDTGTAVRPVDADAIAAVIARKRDPGRTKKSDVYTTTGVSVSHVPVIDPSTGRQAHTTVVGVEEGVGVGAPPFGAPYPSAPTGPNQNAMEQELWVKSLPDGKTTVDVAGYLYFPRPSGKSKNGGLELRMDGQAGRVKLILDDPEKKR